MVEGERQSLGGFFAVNRAKLKALPQEQLMGMLSRDELELIYMPVQPESF